MGRLYLLWRRIWRADKISFSAVFTLIQVMRMIIKEIFFACAICLAPLGILLVFPCFRIPFPIIFTFMKRRVMRICFFQNAEVIINKLFILCSDEDHDPRPILSKHYFVTIWAKESWFLDPDNLVELLLPTLQIPYFSPLVLPYKTKYTYPQDCYSQG